MATPWLLLAWALGATAPAAALHQPAVHTSASHPSALLPSDASQHPSSPQPSDPIPATTRIDPATRVEFSLLTRWGQTLHGRFPGAEGRIEREPDGRRRVRIVLDADSVAIDEHPRYTRFARGPAFFDVAAHPTVEFVSDPYPARLLHDGGDLTGELFLHGVRRRERFVIVPSRCERPGLDCDIVAFGTIQRSDYGVDGWKIALREPVRFALRVRTRGDAT